MSNFNMRPHVTESLTRSPGVGSKPSLSILFQDWKPRTTPTLLFIKNSTLARGEKELSENAVGKNFGEASSSADTRLGFIVLFSDPAEKEHNKGNAPARPNEQPANPVSPTNPDPHLPSHPRHEPPPHREPPQRP